jgi:hypothetical protein
MFWIVGGEGIIHTLAVATGWQFFKMLSVQLDHVAWEGFHFYDLIFPLFLFIVGAVIPYAPVSRIERGEPKPAIYRKVLTRFLLLFFLGLIYNQGWHQNWAKPFIGSVLGEIGFGYLFASLIVLHTRKLRSIVIWTAPVPVGVGMIPRVTTWIRALRDSLKLDQRIIYNATELDREYDAIERKWVTEGFPLVDRQPDPKQAIKTIQTMLAKFASAEKV